ncbi:ribosome silencing factor [Leptolinea tardivitalis]|uniref:ribosome silencing factor n=1 Tax=Leptolinea tardivitalis TaxID=229920 RepID=UPI002E817C65|nr:ribosome silencing factor [Leptolinea tardivitalis]
MLNTVETAKKLITVLEDKKGENIVLLDVSGIASFTDYFIFCNGSSTRMLTALAESLERAARTEFSLHSRIEGNADDGWILIDMGDIVVHLFDPDQRRYYSLEDLWSNGKVLLKIQ